VPTSDLSLQVSVLINVDWKSTVTLIDKSVDNDDQSSVVLHIFGDAKTMPIFRCGDIIIVRQAKVSNMSACPLDVRIAKAYARSNNVNRNLHL
jgi:hypothetical protein